MKTARGLLAAALWCTTIVHAAPQTYCPSTANGVCFSIGIPESSASAGEGNIYFQISAPTKYQWVSLGTGRQMSGSNLFVMYQDGAGNLTLSPRAGTQHTTPQLDTSSTAAQLTLLEGSGVSGDGQTMVANVRCANCQSWSNGGQMSLSSTSASWVGGWKEGSSLASTNQNARIIQHDDTVTFELDLTTATLSSDRNPFTAAAADGEDTGGAGSPANPTGGSGGSGGGISVVSATTSNKAVLAAHGVVMALVFAVLYPLGSLLMPLVGKWWLHAAWQFISFVLMWIGFGLGVKAAQSQNMLFKQTHTLLGTVVVCLLVIQPALGFWHHKHFQAKGARGPVSYAHIWWGRILLVLGVINGGLGLQLALERDSLVIAYSVVAGIVFGVYVLAKAGMTLRGKKQVRAVKGTSTPPTEEPRRPYRKERGGRYV